MENGKPPFWQQSKNEPWNKFNWKNVLPTSAEEIAKTFKNYFDEIVPKLNIIQNKCYIRKTENIEDPVKKALFKDQNHPSIANFEDIMKSKMYPLSVSSLFQ